MGVPRKLNLPNDPTFNRKGWETDNPNPMIPLPRENFYIIGTVPIHDPKRAEMYGKQLSARNLASKTPRVVQEGAENPHIRRAKRRARTQEGGETRGRGRRSRKQNEEEDGVEPYGEELDDPSEVNPFEDEEFDDGDIAVSRFF